MKPIHYSTSFKALSQYIKQYNSTHDDLSEQIRQSTAATAKEIIRIYGSFLAKQNGIAPIDKDDLPGVRTNNVQLAKLGHSSPRTIQRHIKRLEKANVIIKKVWHGSNSSYELWINPEILLVRDEKTEQAEQKALEARLNLYLQSEEEPPIFHQHTTFCPHTETGNKRYITNTIIAVDNSEDSLKNKETGNETGDVSERSSQSLTSEIDHTGYTTSDEETGHTGEKVAQKNEEAGEKGGEKRLKNSAGKMNALTEDDSRSTSLSFFASMLWTLAKNVLYADVYLTEHQEYTAKELLKEWYEPVQTSSLSSVHQKYIERISLVRKYIAKDPANRYVQLPYKYFDTSNPNGFTGTKKWHKEYLRQKKEVQAKLILHAQIRRYTNNLKKAPEKQHSPLELFRECEMRVSKLKDPALLQEFHAAVLKPNIHQEYYNQAL